MSMSVSTSRSPATVRPARLALDRARNRPHAEHAGRLRFADLIDARRQIQLDAKPVVGLGIGAGCVAGEAVVAVDLLPQGQDTPGRPASPGSGTRSRSRFQVHAAGQRDGQRLLLGLADGAGRTVAFAAGVVRRQVQPGALQTLRRRDSGTPRCPAPRDSAAR